MTQAFAIDGLTKLPLHERQRGHRGGQIPATAQTRDHLLGVHVFCQNSAFCDPPGWVLLALQGRPMSFPGSLLREKVHPEHLAGPSEGIPWGRRPSIERLFRVLSFRW